ncbi:MAG: AbrB/MazE/SpoVT family DNA-binding domain-containing protein [Nitrososphaerales archaeon]
MVLMNETATVTSKSMVTIPSRFRRKYGIKDGDKVEFVELDGSILLIPLKSLKELRGVDAKHRRLVIQGIKEMEKERRRETRLER